MRKIGKVFAVMMCSCVFALFTALTGHAQWSGTVNFDEAQGLPGGFPAATTILQMGAGGPTTFNYDFLTNTGPGVFGSSIYAPGQDAIDDMQLDVTVVNAAGLGWTQTDGDYDTTSSGSFRSDYNVGAGQSRENDFAYVKFDFTFLNGLQNSITADSFRTRHTSTNGSSEGYEWTQVTVNGVSINEGMIGSYTNTEYSDATAVAATPPGTGTGVPYPNGRTMSEFLSGMVAGSVAPGGQVSPGWWSVDDFNTTILDGPEMATTNPGAGNGSVDDNQTIGGSLTSDLGDGNFGLADTALVQQVTYYFGLTDVAFDTDGDGFTQTNTLPAAGVTFFDLGFTVPEPTSCGLLGLACVVLGLFRRR
jgi:hypothetical protein